MRKEVLILTLLVLSVITLVYFSHLSFALSGQDVQSQTGINPDAIPSSPEQAGEIANQYLTQQWGNVIANTKIIGPIHNFLTAHPLIFQILFNEPYTFSATFILVAFFWLWFSMVFAKISKSIPFIKKGWESVLAGILITIILAHINVLKNISLFILQITTSQQTWWVRLLIWLLIFVMVIVIGWASGQLNRIKAIREKREEREMLHETKKSVDAVIKGLQQGTKIRDEIGERTTKDEF